MIVVNCRFLTQHLTGVQRFGIEICLELKRKYGENIIFVAPQNIKDLNTANILGVVKVGRNKGHLWEQIDLPYFLYTQKKPLLLNLTNTAPIFYKSKIITIHDCAFYRYPETFSKSFAIFYKFLIPSIIKSCKHILTVSNFSKQELKQIYSPKQNITVIYNSISSKFCESKNKQLNTALPPYILAVASLNNRKNFIRILEAFTISKISNRFSLKIIGDINSNSFSKLNLENYNKYNIDFLGRVTDDELINYYRNAFGFLFPSLYEGFGIPPLEAQACGCPVVISNVSSLPEIFENSGLICNPFSVLDISAKMDMFELQSVREKLVSLGKLNIKRFSWEKSADQVFDVIKIIEKKNA